MSLDSLLSAGVADQMTVQGQACTYIACSAATRAQYNVNAVVTNRAADYAAALGGAVTTALAEALLPVTSLPTPPHGGDELLELATFSRPARRWRVTGVVRDAFDPAWHLDLEQI